MQTFPRLERDNLHLVSDKWQDQNVNSCYRQVLDTLIIHASIMTHISGSYGGCSIWGQPVPRELIAMIGLLTQNLNCWPSLKTQSVYFSMSPSSPGNLSKTCTADGWTEMHPIHIVVNCGYNLNSTNDDVSKPLWPWKRCRNSQWSQNSHQPQRGNIL